MSLRDQMAHDFATVFANVGEFGESLRYRASPTATPRDIVGVVERFPPVPGDGSREHRMLVTVPARTDDGITPTEVVYDQGQIEVAYRQGGTAQWYYVRRPTDPREDQDSGSLLLELR